MSRARSAIELHPYRGAQLVAPPRDECPRCGMRIIAERPLALLAILEHMRECKP